MPEIKVKNLHSIATPLVCRDKDDFTKYFFSLARVFNRPPEGSTEKENVEFTIEGMQILCHEYLALIMSGKMEPYYMEFGSEHDREESVAAFRQGMLEITGRLMKAGVQMEEANDGRYKIDFEELMKYGKEHLGNE